MEGVNPDFSILMTGDSSSLLDGFGFLQFLQIFLLGDTWVLLSIVPRVSVVLPTLSFDCGSTSTVVNWGCVIIFVIN